MNTEIVLWGLGTIGALGFIIFKMMRAESDRHQRSIDKKASIEELREAKINFDKALERQNTDHRERMQFIEAKQEKEIERLTEDMRDIKDSLQELSREVMTGNGEVVRNVQALMDMVRSGKTQGSAT